MTEAPRWTVAGGSLALDRPVVMGIVNLTPDSFSDGGRFRDADHALAEAAVMVEAGADLIDVGGESTRPGAEDVPAGEELERILPFVEGAARSLGVPVSVDTRKAAVAREALAAGAAVVNDVSGLSHDGELGGVAAEAGAGLVIMHMRGTPGTMMERANYQAVGPEVAAELSEAVARARAAAVPRECIVVDPGIGFAKNARHSLALLHDLSEIRALGYPILVGPSRKSFLGAVLGVPPGERVAGTVASCVMAYLEGARIFRVHDVEPVVQALAVAEAVRASGTERDRSEDVA